jgi:hypothetical protein
MRRPALFWGDTLTALGIVDLWCARNAVVGDSLSECSRAWFRVHTPAGELAFTTALTAGAVILHRHICRKETP